MLILWLLLTAIQSNGSRHTNFHSFDCNPRPHLIFENPSLSLSNILSLFISTSNSIVQDTRSILMASKNQNKPPVHAPSSPSNVSIYFALFLTILNFICNGSSGLICDSHPSGGVLRDFEFYQVCLEQILMLSFCFLKCDSILRGIFLMI